MLRIIGVSLTLLSIFQNARCEGHYSIVAPAVIRPHSEYHVSVSLHENASPCEMRVGIEGIDNRYKNFHDITVQPYTSQLIRFVTGYMAPGGYKFSAEGATGLEFRNEKLLTLVMKNASIFIQSDKAIYKPGDTVKFRILILDMHLKPMPDFELVNIFVLDGAKNRIKEWRGIRSFRGVISEELELSDSPVLGEWNIIANIVGEEKHYKFEVAEYVLPKYDVSIDTPNHQYYQQGKIPATVRTKYTYGKPVKGELTVSVYPKTYGSFQPFALNLIARKAMKIDGKAFVEFDILEELHFKEDYEQGVVMEAIVEEELTGRKQNTTFDFYLHKSKYKIQLTNAASNYKPGLPYSVLVTVQKFDGAPIQAGPSEIRVLQSSSYYEDENATQSVHELDSNGMLRYSLVVGHPNGFTLKFIYMNAEERLGWISAVQSKAHAFIRAELRTQEPRINKVISIEIQSTESLRYLSYQIIGRGDVIFANTIEIPNRKSHTITFLASFAMVPKAQFVVYYIKDNEVISDKLEIEFTEDLQNFLELDVSTKQARPGQMVDLTIISKPNSFIGLLGVDQSVLYLRSGNDLDKSMIFNELDEYSKQHVSVRRFDGLTDDWHDFSSAGAVLLTNARPIEYPETPNPTISPYENEIASGRSLTTIKKTDIGPAHVLRTNTRPPLAGPYAFSRIPKPYWNRPRVHLMHAISDTWLFSNFSSGYEGRHTIHKKVPDTITSWVITGFSLDPVTGLGIIKQPASLEVFQPFFVSLNLPNAVKRDEIVSISATVFNYLNSDLDVEVTLHNTDQDLEFVKMENEVDTPKIELYRRKTINVKSKEGTSLSFMVRPKRVGLVNIKVTAQSSQAGDGIVQMLKVKPEGETQYENMAILVDLRDKSKFDGNFTINIPKNAVSNSTSIQISAIGDLLGGTVKNMGQLIRKPYGCGEQNMLHFVPNVVIMDYLQSTNQLTPAVESRAKRFLELGYQRQLSFKHDDGSYSAFGKTDKIGSIWLTAFVVRSFLQAGRHIQIEQKVISDALDWLRDNQAANGSFPEVGNIISVDMQGESGRGIALTAFVLTAFLEDRSKMEQYQNAINKAVDYVVRNLEGNDDLYAQAISSYALQMANHNAKNYILQTFDVRAMRKDGKQWWQKPTPPQDSKNIWYSKPNSINVEMTAYGLLAMLEAGLYSEALPILKWLLSQRNELGGFQSTQDTFVGLKALAKYAERTSTNFNNVQISLKYDEGSDTRINVNTNNALIQQTYELPDNVRLVNFTATGRGFALLQLSYRYNLNVTGAWPLFTLDPQPNRNSHQDYLHLTVCTSYVPVGNVTRSNMAVMEVEFPSGFTADLDTLPSLEVSENVKKVETADDNTKVIVYFDHMTRKELCPTLDAFRTQKVANQRPAVVTLYDYYDTSRRARQFYRMREVTLCDICEGADCNDTCLVRPSEQRSPKSAFDDDQNDQGRAFSKSSATRSSSYPIIFVIAIFIFTAMQL